MRINCARLLYIGKVSGLWIIGIACFFLTGLAGVGFFYRIELAQAVFLIALPLSIVGAMSLSTARLIADQGLAGDALYNRLARHRVWVQVLGIVAIFVTAMWGMYQNVSRGGFFA